MRACGGVTPAAPRDPVAGCAGVRCASRASLRPSTAGAPPRAPAPAPRRLASPHCKRRCGPRRHHWRLDAELLPPQDGCGQGRWAERGGGGLGEALAAPRSHMQAPATPPSHPTWPRVHRGARKGGRHRGGLQEGGLRARPATGAAGRRSLVLGLGGPDAMCVRGGRGRWPGAGAVGRHHAVVPGAPQAPRTRAPPPLPPIARQPGREASMAAASMAAAAAAAPCTCSRPAVSGGAPGRLPPPARSRGVPPGDAACRGRRSLAGSPPPPPRRRSSSAPACRCSSAPRRGARSP